jgi:hypothetical protein
MFERFKFRGSIEGVLYMYEFKGGNTVQSFRVYFRVNGSNGASWTVWGRKSALEAMKGVGI